MTVSVELPLIDLGFNRLISDIKTKKINTVISKDLSRLGRDYILTGYYLEKFFPENNVRYISLLDGIDTGVNSASNDITPFRAVFNDMYAKDISNKIKSVKHTKQNLGLFIGSKAPYGYKLNKKFPNKLFIDFEAKPIVERIFYEATLGKSCRSIANDLNKDSIPTPSQYALNHGFKVSHKSNIWSGTRIKEMILNEVYIGNMVQGRMKKASYKSKKNIRLPEKDWKIVKNTHDPIIDLNTFQKANEMLLLRKQTRVKTHDYLLKGLIYCHECRNKMYCSSRHLASGTKYYFRCSSNTSSSIDKNCTPHSIRMDYVENTLITAMTKLITIYYNRETLEKIIEDYFYNYYEKKQCSNHLISYNEKLKELTYEIDKLYSDKISGIIEEDDFRRIYKMKKQIQNQINSKITHLKQLNFFAKKRNSIVTNIINNFELNFKFERNYLTYFIEKIEVDNLKKIYIYCNFKKLKSL